MLTVYQHLLRLYPAAHRQQFGDEMLEVFREVWAENETKMLMPRTLFWVHEVAGLVRGAAAEHLRTLIGAEIGISLTTRRFTMRNGFRFPKATAVLMALILAGVVLAIQKGEAISASLPNVNPQIGPIQPVHSTLLPPIALFLAFFYAAGLIGWAILFALRRSGVHRLAEMSGQQK